MNELPLWVGLPAALLLVVGGLLALTGSLCLLKFRHFYARIHAPTLGSTLGSVAVLLASLLVSSARAGHLVLNELLLLPLLFISAPVTAMLLMQAARKREARHADPTRPPST